MNIIPKKYDLLTTSNPKVLKGQKQGYLTAILHLSPSTLNDTKTDLCPHSSKGCRQACLNTAGRGGFDKKVKAARRRKANEFIANPEKFVYKLACEVAYYDRQAKRKGLVLAVRLNGTSDINFYQVLVNDKNIFDLFPTVQFYDYTKDPEIVKKSIHQKNHHATFSHSGENTLDCYLLAAFVNIAVPFQIGKGEALPERYYGMPVIDGDENDLRFLDPPNVAVVLRVKGIKQKKQVSPFIIQIARKVA
jgi:hypothetical protein